MYTQTTFSAFIAAISQIPSILKVYLSIYTEDDYREKGAVCYLSSDERSGYAITSERDLISVFSLPGAKQGAAALKSAIDNGAQTLDCIDGYLVTFYGEFGFVEYERVAWDDEYAPEGWDYDLRGRPDIVFMRRQ